MGGVSRHCELFTAGESECSARWSGPFWPGRPSWKASATRRLRLEGGEQQLLRCGSVLANCLKTAEKLGDRHRCPRAVDIMRMIRDLGGFGHPSLSPSFQ